MYKYFMNIARAPPPFLTQTCKYRMNFICKFNSCSICWNLDQTSDAVLNQWQKKVGHQLDLDECRSRVAGCPLFWSWSEWKDDCKWDNISWVKLTSSFFYIEPYVARSIMSTAINNHIQYNTDVQMLSINWWYCYVCPRGEWGPPSEEGGLPAPWVQQCKWMVWEHLYPSLFLSESHSHCRYRWKKKEVKIESSYWSSIIVNN